jgi:hypothetical protein
LWYTFQTKYLVQGKENFQLIIRQTAIWQNGKKHLKVTLQKCMNSYKYMKRCFEALVIREIMQIRTTIDTTYTPLECLEP